MIRHAAHKWHNSSLLSFLLISLSIFSQIFVYALQLQNYSSLTVCKSYQQITKVAIRPEFFYFLFYRFFQPDVRVGGRKKNKNKIQSVG